VNHTPTNETREIAAAVLANVYFHLLIAEEILSGLTPREANERCWRAYFATMPTYVEQAALITGTGLPEAAARQMYPDGGSSRPGWLTKVPDKGPAKHWTTRCLVAALATDQQLLGADWADVAREHGPGPRAVIANDQAERLHWLTVMIWLLATGAGDLLHCARVAFDRATGRPTRKRQPADPEWLAAELDTGLAAAWEAFRNADDGTGRPFWLIAPPAERPGADSTNTAQVEQAIARFMADPNQRAHAHGAATVSTRRGITKSPKRAKRRNRRR